MSQYGFIGAGTMGGILARALHQTETKEKICISDVSASHAQALAEQLNGQVADNGQIAAECTYIFLAVKPQVLESVLAELSPILRSVRMPLFWSVWRPERIFRLCADMQAEIIR